MSNSVLHTSQSPRMGSVDIKYGPSLRKKESSVPMNSPLRFATWVVPLPYGVAAVVAGLIFPRLEIGVFHGLTSTVSVPAAMAIYSSVASGMMALTAVVFSLAFVVIQFSATAYSPRL